MQLFIEHLFWLGTLVAAGVIGANTTYLIYLIGLIVWLEKKDKYLIVQVITAVVNAIRDIECALKVYQKESY